MHASYQIINQVLWLAYITHKQCIYKFLKLLQMQASTWLCTYQIQTTKFMSLLPLLVCSSCPRMLILLNIAPSWSISCPCLHSHLPYSFVQIFYIFVQISPPLSSMTIKGPTPYEICAMWRSMNTTWRLYHENLLWLDAKSWTRVDGWILIFHFWWTLPIQWNWHHL